MRGCLLSQLAAVAVCLFFTGCVDSKNPLSDPQKSTADARLTGVWRLKDSNGDVTYYHIGGAGEKLPQGMMRVVTVTHRKQSGNIDRDGDLLIFPTTLGANTYLNIIDNPKQIELLEEKGWDAKIASFVFAKYQVEGDTLKVRLTDEDAKTKAIRDGKIKGEVETGHGPTTSHFTDTTENVARFVTSAGDSLFSEGTNRLERVK